MTSDACLLRSSHADPLDIDAPVLRALKRLPKKEKKSLGQLAFELLAEALLRREQAEEELPPFRWHAGALEPRVPLDDQDAIFAALDKEAGP